jgi:GH25 family lysozyme M1 (1,4-beta-N-acetylmuramidase)
MRNLFYGHVWNEWFLPGKSWTFCQYTHRGHVDGIKDGKYNYVDLNVFRGTPEDLEALTISRKSN